MKQHGKTLDFLHHFESLGIPLSTAWYINIGSACSGISRAIPMRLAGNRLTELRLLADPVRPGFPAELSQHGIYRRRQ